ncbi:MAG: biotin/lipoyl-binding protein [Syntrophorhabdus sp.]|jgi:HlyD family secretion protein|nr:biotin/lipoyl-binding protein [Syntrophorhabdus sp.]
MSTQWRKLSLWIALIGIATVIFMVYKTTTVEPVPPPPAPPAQKPADHVIAAAGMVEALRENTSIAVPASALVMEIFVREWDKVKAGAPLLRLDDRGLQAELRTEQADLLVRKAELVKARHQHERTEALLPMSGVSKEEAETRRDEFAIAQARVELARAAVNHTKTLIERLTVRAPISGTVLQVNTRPGEFAISGSSPAPMLLGSITELQVRADVDEQLAPRVKPASKAVGYLKGDTQNPIRMEFVRIEPYVTPKRNLTGSSAERVDTRVLQVIYKFPNDLNRRIYVGQQMNLFIEE